MKTTLDGPQFIKPHQTLVDVETEASDEPISRDPGIPARNFKVQAYHTNKRRETPRSTRISETIVFETLPIFRSVFNAKIHRAFDTNDVICYDPENKARPRPWDERIIYVEELVASRIKETGTEYTEIAGWSGDKLWTYAHCLVKFMSKTPLPYTSFMKSGLGDIESVCILAKCFGATDEILTDLRKNLPPYIKLRLALPPADVKDGARKPAKRPGSPKADGTMKKPRVVVDLTGSTPPPEDKRTLSQSKSSKKEELSPIPEVAYIRLNESSPHYYRMKLKDVRNASEFLGALLADLCKGDLVGSRYNMVGKDIDNSPTLLWDKVLAYFMDRDYGSTRSSSAAMMNSWQEDERWSPMTMFVERFQTEEGSRKTRDPIDHRRAEWFNKFVGDLV
ncbi:hypothetical protein NHQ30_002969 [Ciborinia camelliae]|nr:hypothetical protein NHQ30_002969 [Ciborinia camelliae]